MLPVIFSAFGPLTGCVSEQHLTWLATESCFAWLQESLTWLAVGRKEFHLIGPSAGEDVQKCKKFSKQKGDVFDILSKSLAPSIHGHLNVKKVGGKFV